MIEETKPQKIKRRKGELEALRLPWEATLWKPVFDFMAPYRMSVNVENMVPQKIGTYIFDGTPQSAVQVAVNGFYGNMVSPKLKWQKTSLPISVKGRMAYRERQGNVIPIGKTDITKDGRLDHIKEVKMWLEDTDDVMDSAYRRSNFYNEIIEMFADYLLIATPVIFVEEDIRNNRITFSVRHPGETWIDRDVFGNVDTVYRRLKLSARRVAEKWGIDKLPANIKLAAQGTSSSSLFDFVHAVEMREKRDTTAVNAKNKPVSDIYMSLTGQDDEAIVEEGGHNSFPYIVGTPTKRIPNNPYGYSICMEALVNAAVINAVGKDLLHLSNTVSKPPWMIAKDFRNDFDDRPGAKNYFERPYDSKEQLAYQIEPKGNFPITLEMLERLGKTLEEMLMVPLFQQLSRIERVQDMKATVATYLAGEKVTLIAPQIWGCESILDRLSDSVFEIEFNAGRIPPLPDILYQFLGESIDFEFIGPLSQLQKRYTFTQNINSSLEMGLPLLDRFPELKEKVGWEGLFAELLSTNGMPARHIKSEDEYAAAIEAIQRQQKQIAEMQAMDVMGKTIQRGSGAMEPGSPVAKIMEAMGGKG